MGDDSLDEENHRARSDPQPLQVVQAVFSALASARSGSSNNITPTSTTAITVRRRAELVDELRAALQGSLDAEPVQLWPLLISGVRHGDRDVRKCTRRTIDDVLRYYGSGGGGESGRGEDKTLKAIPASTMSKTLAAIVASLQRQLSSSAAAGGGGGVAAVAQQQTGSSASMIRWLLSVLRGLLAIAAKVQPRFVPSSTEVQSFVDVIVAALGHGLQQQKQEQQDAGKTSAKQGSMQQDDDDGSSSSISSHSSSDRNSTRTFLTDQRIRHEAILCVEALRCLSQKSLIVHWNTLLLEATSSHGPYLDSARTMPRASLMDVVERDSLGLEEEEGIESDILMAGSKGSNRAVALACIQALIASGGQSGFFSGAAQEMPKGRRSAFTPFSARMAAIVDNLRSRIVTLLLASQNDRHALYAIKLIQCTKTLVTATEDVKLIRSHQEVLLQPTLALCSGEGSMVSVAALSLLSALVSSPGSSYEIEPMSGTVSDLEILQLIFRRLTSNDCTTDMKVELLGALQSFSQRYPSLFALKAGQVCEHVTNFFRLGEEESVRMAALTVLKPLAQDKSLQVFLHRTAEDASKDVSANIRCVIADLLPVLQQGCLRSAAKSDNEKNRWPLFAELPMRLALRLRADQDASVRAAVARAVGVASMDRRQDLAALEVVEEEQLTALCSAIKELLVSSNGAGGRTLVNSPRGSKNLLQDVSELVRQRASWSLANFCEVVPLEKTTKSQSAANEAVRCWSFLLTEAFALRNEGERISVNTLRALGALYAVVHVQWVPEVKTTYMDPLRWLCCDGMDRWKSPKTRWNAAAALARALSNSCIIELLLQLSSEQGDNKASELNKVTENVCHALTSEKNFKTRLSSARAAEALLSQRDRLPAHIKDTLQACLVKALRTVDTELNTISFREAQLHAHPLRRLLQSLLLSPQTPTPIK